MVKPAFECVGLLAATILPAVLAAIAGSAGPDSTPAAE